MLALSFMRIIKSFITTGYRVTTTNIAVIIVASLSDCYFSHVFSIWVALFLTSLCFSYFIDLAPFSHGNIDIIWKRKSREANFVLISLEYWKYS